jgi:hypothetical protein
MSIQAYTPLDPDSVHDGPTQAERSAVAKGAALLDDKQPGWAHQIDLTVLHLSSGEECVLGQLFFQEETTIPRWSWLQYDNREAAVAAYDTGAVAAGTISHRFPLPQDWELFIDSDVCVADYMAGRWLLGLNDTQARERGFDQQLANDGAVRLTRYYGLECAWIEEITRRQQQQVPQ